MIEILESVVQTAAEVYEPDDIIGVAGLLVIGLPSTIGAVLAGIALVRQSRSEKKVDTVAAGVAETNRSVNRRPTSARDDLDEIRAIVKDVSDRQVEHGRDIRGIRTDIGEMRGEARQDRQNLADLEGRVTRFARREHPGADPL